MCVTNFQRPCRQIAISQLFCCVMEWKGFEIRMQLITAKAWKGRQKIFQSSQTINSENFRMTVFSVFFLFFFFIMVSSLSTSRIMVCNFNYRITSFSTLLSQSNCALDPGVSSWLWHFANSLYPVPNYSLNVSLHSLTQVKIFNWKNGLSLFFFSFFFFRFPAYGRDTACHDLYQFGLTWNFFASPTILRLCEEHHLSCRLSTFHMTSNRR